MEVVRKEVYTYDHFAVFFYLVVCTVIAAELTGCSCLGWDVCLDG